MTRDSRSIISKLALSISIANLPIGSALAQAIVHAKAMPKIGEVDRRYLSYNIEAVEVTGGRFWKPYIARKLSPSDTAKAPQNQPTGMDANLYEYRPPIDLESPKLRKLAAALGPAYLRVSGT